MELISITKMFSGKFLNMYIAKYKNATGNYKNYEVISRSTDLEIDSFGVNCKSQTHKPDAVGIIAFNDDKSKLLIQKEYRLACNEWVYNFPGGLIDDGETPEVAAKREFYEETGLVITEILDTMTPAYSGVGICNEMTITLICKATGEFKPSTSADEEIEPIWIDKTEAKRILDTEKMSLRTQAILYAWCKGI